MNEKLRRFYIDTGLSDAHLGALAERIANMGIDKRYKAVARSGTVVVVAANGSLFSSLTEAERAQHVLQRGAPDVFGNAVVALVDIGTGPLRDDGLHRDSGPLRPLAEPKLVIYIEDDELAGKTVQAVLSRVGVECAVAKSGREALTLIEDLDPDLVLLDLMMPDMHGWEVMHHMQTNDLMSDIPIIILTSLPSERDRVFAHVVAGVADYLQKPVEPELLRQSVLRVLNR